MLKKDNYFVDKSPLRDISILTFVNPKPTLKVYKEKERLPYMDS